MKQTQPNLWSELVTWSTGTPDRNRRIGQPKGGGRIQRFVAEHGGREFLQRLYDKYRSAPKMAAHVTNTYGLSVTGNSLVNIMRSYGMQADYRTKDNTARDNDVCKLPGCREPRHHERHRTRLCTKHYVESCRKTHRRCMAKTHNNVCNVCIVDGCREPRYQKYARCYEHKVEYERRLREQQAAVNAPKTEQRAIARAARREQSIRRVTPPDGEQWRKLVELAKKKERHWIALAVVHPELISK